MSIVLLGSTSGSCTLQEQAVAGTTTLTLPTFNGTVGLLVSGTSVSASGTSIDFTGLPAGVRRITVMIRGLSTNGSSIPQLQLGSGSIDTSGYLGAIAYVAPSTASASLTSGVLLIPTGWTSALAVSGNVVFTNISSNIWTFSGTLGLTANANAIFIGGDKSALSGALDRVRLTTVNGTDTFDAGSINILYE
jgi:hypothetical protein